MCQGGLFNIKPFTPSLSTPETANSSELSSRIKSYFPPETTNLSYKFFWKQASHLSRDRRHYMAP